MADAGNSINIKKESQDLSDPALTKIFIGGLSLSTDEAKLRNHFKQYGSVQDAVVMKDPVTKRSRGFGFVTFGDLDSLENALSNDPHMIDSRKVEAKRAVPRSEIPREPRESKNTKDNSAGAGGGKSGRGGGRGGRSDRGGHGGGGSATATTAAGTAGAATAVTGGGSGPRGADEDGEYAHNKIFVGGLHYDTKDGTFRKYFEQFGKVMSSEVMFNRETGKARGFGFVVFELESSAIKTSAVKQHFIDGKEVEVKRAVPRSKLPSGTPTPSMLKSNQHQQASGGRRGGGGGGAAGSAGGPGQNAADSSSSGKEGSGGGGGGGAILSGTSGVRKPTNAVAATATVPVTATRGTVSATSYAAALKLGAQKPQQQQQQQQQQQRASAVVDDSAAMLLQAGGAGVGVAPAGATDGQPGAATAAGGADLQTLLFAQDLSSRPYRSNSEPVSQGAEDAAGAAGSSALQGDVLPPSMSRQSSAAGAIRQNTSASASASAAAGGATGAGTSNSNSSSRSNSILNVTDQQAGGAVSNANANGNLTLPWLSSATPAQGGSAAGAPGSLSLGQQQVSGQGGDNTADSSALAASMGLGNLPGLSPTQLQMQMQQMQQLHQLQMQQMQLQMQQMQQAAQMQQPLGTMMPNGLFLPNPPGGIGNMFGMNPQAQLQFLQQQQQTQQQEQPGSNTASGNSGEQGGRSGGASGAAGGTAGEKTTQGQGQQQGIAQDQLQQQLQQQQQLFQQSPFGAGAPFSPYYMDYMAAMAAAGGASGAMGDPSQMMFYGQQGMVGGGGPFFPQQQGQGHQGQGDNYRFHNGNGNNNNRGGRGNGGGAAKHITGPPPGVPVPGPTRGGNGSGVAGPGSGPGGRGKKGGQGQGSETDDLFQFNELSFGGSEFNPTAPTGWL